MAKPKPPPKPKPSTDRVGYGEFSWRDWFIIAVLGLGILQWPAWLIWRYLYG